jgi:hypothetical protein
MHVPHRYPYSPRHRMLLRRKGLSMGRQNECSIRLDDETRDVVFDIRVEKEKDNSVSTRFRHLIFSWVTERELCGQVQYQSPASYVGSMNLDLDSLYIFHHQ